MIIITQGDSGFLLKVKCMQDGQTMTGISSASFRAKNTATQVITEKPMSIVNAPDHQLEFTFSGSDSAIPGNYIGTIVITKTDASITTSETAIQFTIANK